MIISRQPVSAQQAKRFVDKDSEVMNFLNQVSGIDFGDADKMYQEIVGLNLMKLRDEQIVKIIEMLPETSDELNKIFADISLDEEESAKIIDVIKKYK